MKIDGSCHCKYLTYEAEIDEDHVGLCHCMDCQTFGGTAVRGFSPSKPGTFKLLSGEPSLYEKTSAKGEGHNMNFCPRCGTQICSTGVDPESTFCGIRTGTITQRNELPPKMHAFCRSAQDWVWDIASLPRFETNPDA